MACRWPTQTRRPGPTIDNDAFRPDLNAHLHLGFLQGKIDASDFGLGDLPGHLLTSDGAVEGVTVDEHRFSSRPTVSLQHVHGLDRILDTCAKRI